VASLCEIDRSLTIILDTASRTEGLLPATPNPTFSRALVGEVIRRSSGNVGTDDEDPHGR